MKRNLQQTDSRLKELSGANFDATVDSSGIVLVKAWAPWCSACEAFGPAFDAAAQRHPHCTFASINTQQHGALMAALGIAHLPTLLLFRDGLLLFNQPGSWDAKGLDDIVAQAQSLDMDEVRAELEDEKYSVGRDQAAASM